MSIGKAKVFLKAKLSRRGNKLIAKALNGDIVILKEEAVILSRIKSGDSINNLSSIFKKDINYILKMVMRLEEQGVVSLKLFCEDPILKELYRGKNWDNKIFHKKPAISNIIAYEKEWSIFPSTLDFLNKESDNYQLKCLEKDIYLNIIYRFLNKIPKGSSIIDAGGGIGRFTSELIKKGYKVNLLDSSEIALKKALRHFVNADLPGFDLHWGNVNNLSMFADSTFDAAFAIELICYTDRPDQALKELVRVTKKNGLIIISVEGKYGSMLSDRNVSFDRLPGIFKIGSLYIKKHLYVNYYTPKTLKQLLEECGIRVVDIVGSHYVTDGIFHRLINVDKLDNKKYKNEIFKIESLCQNDPVLKGLARAWVVVGRKNLG